MSKPGALRLREMLARNHALADCLREPGFALHTLEALQHWQRERLQLSYADLARRASYRPAIHFFLSELYGGLDFQQRDQQLDKVMPLMERFLPDETLATMSEAFELQAISLEFDMAMAVVMAEQGLAGLDMATYGEVYRACGDRAGRQRQIELIRKLGYDLEVLVRKPWINPLVRLLRGPAHAAGFGRLQEFLEQGLESFRALDDIPFFIESVFDREWGAMEKLFDGADRPFGF